MVSNKAKIKHGFLFFPIAPGMVLKDFAVIRITKALSIVTVTRRNFLSAWTDGGRISILDKDLLKQTLHVSP